MSTSWLHKHRKQQLLDLSSEAGLPQDDDLKKDEIVDNLEQHLQRNATRLSRDSTFEGYFGTRRTPFKARSSSAGGITSDDGEVKSVVKGRGRRQTKVKSEIEEIVDQVASPSQQLTRVSNAITSRTPGRPRRSQLPPSPADIADDVEYTTSRLSTSIHNAYAGSGITQAIDAIRESLSSVTAVQTTLLFIEAFALQRKILFWEYAFDIPPLAIIAMPRIPVYLPDFFWLLDPIFWSLFPLWATTNILLPAAFGYFYNLSTRSVKRGGYKTTLRRYSVDPLVFNVVKALLGYVVYERGHTFGLFYYKTPEWVQEAMFGGSTGMLIGSGVGVLVALYEAAQAK